ncbi:MAG: liaR [Chloroflexi bacterium]|jgi:DNA-binding NarL/FixJ family response regulator|nr:liaR [Chloroflexota bacterium]MDB5075216.1 liaR [Chloroflexota bacterium]
MIGVLIVDDHPVAREGLRRMLERSDDIYVVGEAKDGVEALEQVAELHPNVVLMDIRMPGPSGLDVTRLVKAEVPATAVIIVTSYDDEALLMDTILAGASGFLLKDASRNLLVHTIHAVAAGGMLVDAIFFRQAFDTAVAARHELGAELGETSSTLQLTEPETRILQLLAEGRTNKQIAVHHGLSELAAKKQIQTLVTALHATNRTHAVAIAVRLGLIN